MIVGLSYIVWYFTVFFYSSLLLLEPFAAYLDSDLTQIELMIWRNPEPKCVSLQTSENLSNEIKMWETESHDNYLLKVCLQAVIWGVRIFLWLYNGLQAAKCFYQTENYIKRPFRSLASGADNTQQWFHPLWASVITVAQAGKPNFLNIFTRCWRDDPVSRQSTC